DRDQGIAVMSTTKAFTPPPGAIAIAYKPLSNKSTAAIGGRTQLPERGPGAETAVMFPVPRRLATAQIGGAAFAMHLDLGAAPSQLRESSWDNAHLTPADVALRLVDEAASVRRVAKAGVAAEVMLGPVKVQHVTFAPFVERRFGK